MADKNGLSSLKGVGPALEARLNSLGIFTRQDLLFHLPLRYEDRTRVIPLSRVSVGIPCLVSGEVTENRVEFGRRRSLWVRIRDESGGQIGLRFYAFSKAQQLRLATGTRLRCFGEVRMGRSGFEMYHPETDVLGAQTDKPIEDRLTAVYPTSEGLPQKRLRDLVDQVLDQLDPGVLEDLLPARLVSRWGYPDLFSALNNLHRPEVPDPKARERLVLEELLAHHLSLLQLRDSLQQEAARPCEVKKEQEKQFHAGLPFGLTAAQLRVLEDIRHDMAGPVPMLRLIQGDVGSGKTVVAALAALTALSRGYQVAVMAPTEILAEQHLRSFEDWFSPLGYSIAWLSGKVKGRRRAATLSRIRHREDLIVVGTHALFQDDVVYARLALVIVDEQHRFGVHQRLSLQEKGRDSEGRVPHQLIMTATPIPRTLAMSAYADLDTSVIDELPPGRSPVITRVLSDERREDVVERLRALCQQGQQAYWVCTLVEESEALQCQAAEVAAQLLAESLPGIQVGLVHGRLKADEKAAVMAAFTRNEIQLLVATTVIEVGVNVPNASLMVIENPERLGLAQLHQLRGRVGRGTAQSFCLLMYHAPLSANARERLNVLRETEDGFRIAEKDLELRGPGELLGTRQTGVGLFHLADLQKDAHLLEPVREIAPLLLPDRKLCERLIERWLSHRSRYARV